MGRRSRAAGENAPLGEQGSPPAADGDEGDSRPVTLTALLDVGAIADRGSVLYAADGEPVVALLASEPLFRDLSFGSRGDDVRALEENLAAFGYGSKLTVDDRFDAATTAAVRAWEADLGRSNPDGVVMVGEVATIPGPASVTGHRTALGDKLTPGAPVLVLGTESRVVKAWVDLADAEVWAPGTVVGLRQGDQASSGSVTEVGREEVGGNIEITITPFEAGSSLPVGKQLKVVATSARSNQAVTVPVSALIEGPSGPAVRTVTRDGDRLTSVEVGVVSGGVAEIVDGLAPGAKVRLPG